MSLTQDDLTYLLHCAQTAATQAGQLITRYAGTNVAVQHKNGGDTLASQVVTEVDLRSESIIVAELQPSCDRYDLALLSEERVDDKARLYKDYFWCVDPMDGTLSFIESKPGYAVSIALVSRVGIPIIGVIYDPVDKILYSAVAGRGVLRNGLPWSLTSHKQATMNRNPLTVVCDRGFIAKKTYPYIVKTLESIAKKHGYSGLHTLEKNGAVLNACWVLENPPAIYFKCPKREQGGGNLWDFAATALLFTELGCVASDFFGQALDLNRTNSTYMNHRGVIYAREPSLATQILTIIDLCNEEP